MFDNWEDETIEIDFTKDELVMLMEALNLAQATFKMASDNHTKANEINAAAEALARSRNYGIVSMRVHAIATIGDPLNGNIH